MLWPDGLKELLWHWSADHSLHHLMLAQVLALEHTETMIHQSLFIIHDPSIMERPQIQIRQLFSCFFLCCQFSTSDWPNGLLKALFNATEFSLPLSLSLTHTHTHTNTNTSRNNFRCDAPTMHHVWSQLETVCECVYPGRQRHISQHTPVDALIIGFSHLLCRY